MRRHLVALTVVGAFGVLLGTTEAQACHKKKCCHTPPPCPTVVVVECPPPPPPCPPPPVCQPKPKKSCGTCGGHHGLLGGMRCHRKAKMACAPAPVPCGPVVYEAPAYYPTPQGYATPQGYPTPQGMMPAPPKAAPQG